MKKTSVNFFVFCGYFFASHSFCAEYSKLEEKSNSISFRRDKVRAVLPEDKRQLLPKVSLEVSKEMIEGSHQHCLERTISQKEPSGCAAFYRCFDYERD